MISYIQAIDVIRAFALQHVFVSKFNYEFKEQMPNLGTVDEAYPFLYVVPTGANVTEFTNEFDLDIYCVDRLQKDRTNTNFILNDCQQVLADLSLWLEQGQDDIEIIQSYPMTPINNDLLDYVAGWVMRVRVQVTRIGLCEIPFGGESPTPPTCPSGFVRNSDGSYQELVPSGGELILPDTPVLVVDQNQNELANENVISVTGGTIEVFIEPCQDATVENSNQSYTDTIASGGTLVLPDITVTDSDGSTYTQPSVTDVVCTPNEIDVYINRILVAEDATEDVLLTLTDQEGNALTFTQNENALSVNIPECEDAHVNINGIEVGTAPSGGILDLNLIDQNSDVVPFVQTGSDLVVTLPSAGTNSAPLMKTGQTTSYRTGDDGDIEAGRAVDFFNLDFVNFFGHSKRFTGITGSYYDEVALIYRDVNGVSLGNIGTSRDNAFPNYLMIDWSSYNAFTGDILLYYLTPSYIGEPNLDFTTCKTFADAINVAGFTGFRVCNFNELYSAFFIWQPIVYPPIVTNPGGIGTVGICSDTTEPNDNTLLASIRLDAKFITSYSKTLVNPVITRIFCKYINISEL